MKKNYERAIPYLREARKLMLIMKLTLLFLIVGLLQVSASVYSQTVKFSLNLRNQRVIEVLNEIEDNSEFRFFYQNEQINTNRLVTVKTEDASVEEILSDVFRDTEVSFKIMDEKLILLTVDNKKSDSDSGIQQKKKVTGKVTDTEGQSLPGVTVVVKGTTTGTVTDMDGAFSLPNVDDEDILLFSFVGMKSQEIPVMGKTNIDIVMEEESIGIGEVVAIGYGTVKKSDLTGAVSSVNADDLKTRVGATFDQLMTGQTAGVNIVQSSGEPGAGVTIKVRGSASVNAGTSPLYVIDGYAMDNGSMNVNSGAEFDGNTARNPLTSLNPSDIESIEILKDASATAIYGARGANGVIIITTKKGASGKPVIAYDAYYGVQSVANRIDVLTAPEYKTVLNGLIADGASSSSDMVEDYTGGTDWQDEIFKSSAPVQSHNLSLRGGTEAVKYFASMNYYDQQGVVISSGYKRYGARTNLEITPSEKLQFGININANYEKSDDVPTGFGINGESGAIYSSLNFDPTLSVKDENGDYVINSALDMDNPVASAKGKEGLSNAYRAFGTFYAQYEILPDLKFKINLSGDARNERRDTYVSRLTKHGAASGGIASISTGQKSNFLEEATLTYAKKIGVHSINAVVGSTFQKFMTSYTFQTASEFPSDATGTDNMSLGTQSTYDMGSSKYGSRLLSYLGRVNYDYNNRFLLTASLRIDGSSKFGSNNRFGYFPSAAFGWKLHNESFMKDISAISVAKLRASWGQTGNEAIGNNAYMLTYSTGADAILDGEAVSSTAPTRLPNPDLKWETTEQTDIGIDFGLFDSRISGTADYFQKTTKDMLLNKPVSSSTGFTSKLENAGSAAVKGWEFSLSTFNLTGAFTWKSTINVTSMKSEVKNLGGVDEFTSGSAGQSGNIFIVREGRPLYAFYGYEVEGIWQSDDDFSVMNDTYQPGDLKFKDQNEDGSITAEDKVILGTSMPNFEWGFINSFGYKNFELSVSVEGSHGGKMLNQNLVDSYYPVSFRRNRFAEPYLNRWTESNPSDKYPSFVSTGNWGSTQVNTITVEDASYIRLKNISLRYNFNLKKTSVIKSLNVYVTAENLLTLTDYSGFDPTINPNGGDPYRRVDFSAYPTARTIITGISVEF